VRAAQLFSYIVRSISLRPARSSWQMKAAAMPQKEPLKKLESPSSQDRDF
jgi:hypothetical protein